MYTLFSLRINPFNYAVVGEFVRGLKSAFTTIGKLTDKSAEYLENINLFQVAFNGAYEEAEKFVNQMTEMYGLDESKITKTVGIFKQLSNAMKLSVEEGTKLSTLMTQMSLDISSLYNIDIERASSVLQSSLAGQTKPIRGATGADITESTLQTTLSDIGIDRYVGDLNYAEKRLLIIISLTQQLKESTDDFGRTIESPANQMRILNEQWERLNRAVGNVFLPILETVLPYLNAIVMVLTEIINMIATLIGYNQEDYNYLNGVSDSAIELEESLGGASAKAKELKQGLRGFDKLNVIKTPSSGDAGSGAGGIDPDLMNAFNDAFDSYQSKLENVTMKATKIRDAIMEWLGFTKMIDEETGKVYFKFEKLTGGTVLGALAVGGAIYSGIYGIVNLLKKLGFGTLFAGVGNLFKTIGKATGITALFKAIGDGMGAWLAGLGSVKEIFTVFIIPALKTVGTKLGGIGLIIGGLVSVVNGIKDAFSGDLFNGITDALQGVALIVAGIGLFVNPLITLIALAVAGVGELIQLVVNNWETISNFFQNIWQSFNEKIIKPITDFVSNIAKTVYTKVIEPIINFFKPISDAIIEIKTLIINEITNIVVGVGNALGAIFSKIGEIFAKIVEIFVALGKAGYEYIIKPFISWLGELFVTAYDKFIKPFFDGIVWLYNKIKENFVQPFVNAITSLATTVYDKFIKPFFNWVVWLKDQVVGIFKGIGTTVVTFISDLFKSVINGVLGAIESGINKFIKLLNSAIGIINEIPGVNITKVTLLKIPRLEKGMDFVPKDFYGPVYLDYGERVLTKEENRDYSAGLYAGGNQNSKGTIFNPTFVIQVGDEVIARKVLNDLQDMAKSDGKPIVIS